MNEKNTLKAESENLDEDMKEIRQLLYKAIAEIEHMAADRDSYKRQLAEALDENDFLYVKLLNTEKEAEKSKLSSSYEVKLVENKMKEEIIQLQMQVRFLENRIKEVQAG